MKADDIWDSEPKNIFYRTIPCSKFPSSRVFEFFEIREFDGDNLEIRALDLFELTLRLEGFIFDDKRNWFSKHTSNKSPSRFTVFFPPQHIAETIYPPIDNQGRCCDVDHWPKAKLYPSRRSRLEFEVPHGEGIQGKLSVGKLLQWQYLNLKIVPRADSHIGLGTKSQLQALFKSVPPSSG